MITKVLINHSDTYYYNVDHSAFVAKWRIRLGLSLVLHTGNGARMRIPRRNVVALAEHVR